MSKGSVVAIPEAQLKIWSRQGSITQSKATYASIRNALQSAGAGYAGKDYQIFLQGSYANSTNIYRESDVDVAIRLDSTLCHGLEDLSEAEKQAHAAAFPVATYSYGQFKQDVIAVLRAHFGNAVTVGNKAIKIAGNGGRRDADVVVAIQFRRYNRFTSVFNPDYVEGICLFDAAGNQIVNYPKQHAANCTAKHQATSNRFKPLARVLKNMKVRMVDDGMIGAGVAPSYFIEGLLYNVPDNLFVTSRVNSFVNTLNYLLKADRSKFVCANEQYYLLRDTPVTWSSADCDQFLGALQNFWGN